VKLTQFNKSYMQIAIEIDITVFLFLSWIVTVKLELTSTKERTHFELQ
jgi:hypothetical protein